MTTSTEQQQPQSAPEPSAPVRGEQVLDSQSGRFFRRVDWVAFWTAMLVTLAVYVYTLAPTVTLEDSGELAVASDYLGVPHPPGYPIWTLLSWFFQWIFHWKTYYGQPNPAWSVGLMSAVFGALACGILALLISRSGADMLRSMRSLNEILGYQAEKLICWAGGVAGGLLLAFSPGLWSQSVIVEVYSLNAFFLMLILLLAFMWVRRPHEAGTLFALAFCFGLGLTNHQTLMFVGLGLAAAVLFRDLALFRDFCTVGFFYGILLGINIWAKGHDHPQWMWSQGPGSTAFWVYTSLFVSIPIVAYFVLPKGRIVGPTVLLALLGISFYLYLPFASEGNPPMNWAYPRTWEGFLHAITRGQYEKVTLSNVFSDPQKFMGQLGAYFRDLRGQYTLPIALLGMLPFTTWSIRLGKRRFNAFYSACILIVLTAVFAMIAKAVYPGGVIISATEHVPFLAKLYKFIGLGLMGLAGLGVLLLIVLYFRSEIRERGMAAALAWFLLAVIAGAMAYLDLSLLRLMFSEKATTFHQLVYLTIILLPPAATALVWWMINGPLKMETEIGELSQRWTLVTLVSFFALSVVLIIFLNHQLDIQTLFIGRVQLIQSHAVYAIWLGYGLIFALARLEALRSGRLRRLLWISAPTLAVLLPLISIIQNAYDEDRLRILGGAEQNGHDFGWQFGNYELRGAAAITEELKPGEPPLPDPNYPPPMSTNAIFFGGTDPGRFVPTYMIYSAKVRPDVFLITQNALADNTYMNVMRDLYGDVIWIPSQQDSNFAFQQYVKDVRSGKLDAGAAVTIKDGRVSVQGVQGVMLINGILAKMIFEANKNSHGFYVEESYVIPWMYPYLEPHGLIMKINKNPIRVTQEMVKKDRDFWDWYCRRLIGEVRTVPLDTPLKDLVGVPDGARVRVISEDLDTQTKNIRIGGNSKFLRDIVARKTFSKLRSAIAGIYVYRRMYDQAIYAFKQSINLYPLSPEANFRLADVYMQLRQFDKARAVMEKLADQDPGNDRVVSFLKQVRETDRNDKRRQELEAEFAKGSSDVKGALELCQLYLKLGLRGPFEGLTRKLLTETRLPLTVYLQIGQLYANARRFDLLEFALQKYLERDPNNVKIWLDLSATQAQLGKKKNALDSLARAIQLGGAAARDVARKDPRFNRIREEKDFQKLVPPIQTNLPLPLQGL